MSNPLPKAPKESVKKVVYPLSVCTVSYEELPDKYDNKTPPPPCNGWCRRKVTAPDGEVVEDKVMPWLDETKGKLMYVGVDQNTGKPVTAPHLKFKSVSYITHVEHCPKYDDAGQIIRQWFNEDKEAVEPPDDINKPPKGWTAQIQYAFDYIIGVDAQQWMSEHIFRLSANAQSNLNKHSTLLSHVVNNTGGLIQLMGMAVQQEQSARGEQIGPLES